MSIVRQRVNYYLLPDAGAEHLDEGAVHLDEGAELLDEGAEHQTPCQDLLVAG